MGCNGKGHCDDLAARLAAAEKRAEEAEAKASETDHWRVKARCYGDIVHGCSPALAAAGFPVDSSQHDGAVGGIARSVSALAETLASERAARVAAERERDEARKERDAAEERASELGDAIAQALEQKVPDVRALRGAAFQQFWAWQEVSGHIPAGTSLYGEVEACIEEAFRLGAIAAESSLSRAVEALRFYGQKINHTDGSVMADAGDRARAVLAEVGK